MSKLWPEDTYEDTSYDYDDEEYYYGDDYFEHEMNAFRREWERYTSDDCDYYTPSFRGKRLA